MGPRRKLELAVKQLKEQTQNESSSDSFRQGDTTPTPSRDNEKEMKVQLMRLQSALTQVSQYIYCVYQLLIHVHIYQFPVYIAYGRNTIYSIHGVILSIHVIIRLLRVLKVVKVVCIKNMNSGRWLKGSYSITTW